MSTSIKDQLQSDLGDAMKARDEVAVATIRLALSAIKKAGGPNLDKRVVQLQKAHIKSVGSHPVSLRLHPEVDVAVVLAVVAEN